MVLRAVNEEEFIEAEKKRNLKECIIITSWLLLLPVVIIFLDSSGLLTLFATLLLAIGILLLKLEGRKNRKNWLQSNTGKFGN